MVFENRALRRIFRPKREEVALGWRRVHNEELCNLYTSSNINRVTKLMIWAAHVVCMVEIRNAYDVLVGKSEGMIPCGRSRCRWEGNIRIEIGWEGMDWIHLAQDRDQWQALVDMVMNLWVP
jgi:hypothetical protein